MWKKLLFFLGKELAASDNIQAKRFPSNCGLCQQGEKNVFGLTIKTCTIA